MSDEHAELNAAIDELATTTPLSRDAATNLAMNYPDPDFLRFVARSGALRFAGIDSLWAMYHTPPERPHSAR